MRPGALILLSFLSLIAIGSALLMMPFATRSGTIAYIDALFTSASAVCVTGLVVADTGSAFTGFGQLVILVLIQIGGLGVMTISVSLFQLIGRSVPFTHRLAVQDVFSHTPRADILKLLRNLFFFTAMAELIGVLFLWARWQEDFGIAESLWLAVFHSISAFCNAGFSLFSDNLMRYSGSLIVNLSICGLIVIGGIGFPVLHDLYIYSRRKEGKRRRLSVQTRTVLVTTAVLIAGGAIIIAALERNTIGAHESAAHRIFTPIFQSITCRTAGFNTLDIGALGDATLFLMIFLMFVGASPGSTGGGVKTTTLAVMSAFTVARVKRSRRVNLFKKSIPEDAVTRSAALALVSIGIIGFSLFMVLLGNPASHLGTTGFQRPFLAYLFETVSAFGTVGLSMGVTAELTAWSKAWIIATMIVGRVGVLTFAYLIAGTAATGGVEHAEESVMIG